jgi:peroxiredoxin
MNLRRWLPSWRSLLLDLAIALVLLLLLRAFMQRDMISGPAPDFALADLDGQVVSLASYRGDPMVLHFWATWCPICALEENSIDALADDYPLLGVAMQSGESAAVRKHLDERTLAFRNVNDPGGELAAQYGVSAVPATFILDGAGEIRFVERGWSSEWGLRARLIWLKLFG